MHYPDVRQAFHTSTTPLSNYELMQMVNSVASDVVSVSQRKTVHSNPLTGSQTLITEDVVPEKKKKKRESSLK